MKLADRIAAWFGYVPLPDFIALQGEHTELVLWRFEHETRELGENLARMIDKGALTAPHVIVSADYKRGIPCS